MNSITRGMGTAGSNTTNSMLIINTVTSTTTETVIKAVEDQLNK